MEIKGKVHCFFEQSGTFKNEFIKLGIPAEDYDIQNNFGETDHTDDLFKAIEDAYDGKPSLWDNITQDDFIMAFFPCIYFCATSQMAFFWTNVNYRAKSMKEKTDLILQRSKDREYFFSLAVKMLAVAQMRGLRLVMENPWSEQTFLKANFVAPPSLVDMDRTKRGDYYTKPTAYWFINCEPTHGRSFQRPKEHKTIMTSKGASRAGLCSEERSLISPDYARNFHHRQRARAYRADIVRYITNIDKEASRLQRLLEGITLIELRIMTDKEIIRTKEVIREEKRAGSTYSMLKVEQYEP